ncbi:Choline kinase [hydrothermal vent metagenome]|uniref:Choline kinase n=1 Tax=hydrothermal vent metagenome TaxID=652676 RepID=A0A1W1ECB5_9ZZZZ
MNIDLSKYSFFKDHSIENLTLLENQGYSNRNYKFTYNKSKYLLRMFLLEDRDRELEYKVQTLAFENGIAAKPIVLDLENNLMICDFLEGDHKEKLQTEDIKNIAYLLNVLHRIEINHTTIDIEKEFKEKSQDVIEAFSYIDSCKKEIALCHNDLNPKNFIFSNKSLKLIDWEFAATNDIYFDLASVSVEYNLDLREEAYLLAFYFGIEGWNKKKLDAYKVIYKALCKQWFKENTEPI